MTAKITLLGFRYLSFESPCEPRSSGICKSFSTLYILGLIYLSLLRCIWIELGLVAELSMKNSHTFYYVSTGLLLYFGISLLIESSLANIRKSLLTRMSQEFL